MDEELEIGAVPAATSSGYGDAVTDEEFEEWVRRSQDGTEAALREWDTSVQFDQMRNGDGGMTMAVDIVPEDPERPEDVGLVEAVIYNEDGTVYEPPADTPWQAIRDRILAGEEIGPEGLATVLGIADCDDPHCPIHHPDTAPPMPQWALEAAQRLFAGPPDRQVIYSMPRRAGRSRMYDELTNIWATIRDPLAELRASLERQKWARRNLEQMGFVVVDGDAAADTITLPRSALVKETNRFGYFVSEIDVMNATVSAPTPSTLILPAPPAGPPSRPPSRAVESPTSCTRPDSRCSRCVSPRSPRSPSPDDGQPQGRGRRARPPRRRRHPPGHASLRARRACRLPSSSARGSTARDRHLAL